MLMKETLIFCQVTRNWKLMFLFLKNVQSCLCLHLRVSINVNSFISLGPNNKIHHSLASCSGDTVLQKQRLGSPSHTACHWTSSMHRASNNHSKRHKHHHEQSGCTFGIAQFSLMFMVYFTTMSDTSHYMVSNGKITGKWWSNEDSEGNTHGTVQVISSNWPKEPRTIMKTSQDCRGTGQDLKWACPKHKSRAFLPPQHTS